MSHQRFRRNRRQSKRRHGVLTQERGASRTMGAGRWGDESTAQSSSFCLHCSAKLFGSRTSDFGEVVSFSVSAIFPKSLVRRDDAGGGSSKNQLHWSRAFRIRASVRSACVAPAISEKSPTLGRPPSASGDRDVHPAATNNLATLAVLASTGNHGGRSWPSVATDSVLRHTCESVGQSDCSAQRA